jgi:hypothetical protein
VALAVGSTAVAAAVTGYAVTLYRPLFRPAPEVPVTALYSTAGRPRA